MKSNYFFSNARWIWPLAGVVLLIGIWFLLSSSKLINPLFLASPSDTALEWKRLLLSADFRADIFASLRRIFVGVGISVLIGLPLGLILGLSASINRMVSGVMDFLRSIPPVVLYPLALLIFGIGDASRIAVVVFGAVTVILLNTSEGVRNCSRLRQKTNQLLGAKWHHILTRIVFFESLPSIIVGIRSALSWGIIIVIVTEMLVGASHGLGTRVINAQISFATPQLYAVILTVGLIGYLLNLGFVLLERKACRWRH